jgi:hypothetical protein
MNELTVDHVPAQQLGGNRMVLTCEACNHQSGTFVQAEMRKREQAHYALTGPLDQPEPVKLTLSTGAVVRAEIVKDGDVYSMNVLDQNSPEALERFREDMTTVTAEGNSDWSLNLEFYRYSYHAVAAHVGWLREAYLVAFAVLGYRYILDPALEIVRQQIARPLEKLIRAFKVEDRRHAESVRLCMIVNEPNWIRSVAIQFGHRTVLLPQLGDGELYGRLEERQRSLGGNREQVDFAGNVLDGWPKGPMHLMDFALQQPLFVSRLEG